MDYKYDVFISYRRNGHLPNWVDEFLFPMLKQSLNDELKTHDVRIFVDSQLEANVAWPSTLAKRLARSAVLVPLWARSYFRSEWCFTEFAHMCYREQTCGCRTLKNEIGLICPAIVHDGEENLPTEAQAMQCVNLQDYALAHLQPKTHDAIELEKRIKLWAPSIAKSIENAPKCKKKWEKPLDEAFLKTFSRQIKKQMQPPWSGK